MATLTTSPATIAEPPPTSQTQLDDVVSRLKHGARKFVGLSLDQRVQLTRAMQAGYLRVARASVEAACLAKGITLGSALEGEEWTLGPWFVVRHLRLLRESLLSIRRTGNTRVGKLGRTADQRLTVQVFPAGPIDSLLF
ncbi:MAG: aldehyde dehydrogenase, partial [Gemmatimonadales bacterium]